MENSKRAYISVQRALRNRASSVTLSDVWRELHNELGIGSLSSKHLTLNSSDHARLREWYVCEVGADPLITDIKGDRLEVAALVRDEKWSAEAVFAGLMRVNTRRGEVPLRQGAAVTPPGTLLEVDPNEIRVDQLNAVILVENGIIARQWHQCMIPADLSGALMVYRGHNPEEVKSVRGWLQSLPETISKIGYFDFDPAGLGMAIDYNMDAILIPDKIDDLLANPINNKPNCFADQLRQRPSLGDQIPRSCRTLWSWMSETGRHCAVTQERLTIMNWNLNLLLLQ